jgi:hypothetical protein
VLSSGSFVVNDTEVGGEDNETELSRRKEIGDDLLVFSDLDVKSGGDDSAFINST